MRRWWSSCHSPRDRLRTIAPRSLRVGGVQLVSVPSRVSRGPSGAEELAPAQANIRTTAFSPNSVGKVLTRISTSPGEPLIRPSWGRSVAIGQELRQHLEPRDHVGRNLPRQERDPVQNPVDSPARLHAVATGLEVHVAGPGGPRQRERLLDGVGSVRTGRIELREGLGYPVRRHEAFALHCFGAGFFAGAFLASAFSPRRIGSFASRDDRTSIDFPAPLQPIQPRRYRSTFGKQNRLVFANFVGTYDDFRIAREGNRIARLESLDRLFGNLSSQVFDHFRGCCRAQKKPPQIRIGYRHRSQARLHHLAGAAKMNVRRASSGVASAIVIFAFGFAAVLLDSAFSALLTAGRKSRSGRNRTLCQHQ